jgi:hypothetical protein
MFYKIDDFIFFQTLIKNNPEITTINDEIIARKVSLYIQYPVAKRQP